MGKRMGAHGRRRGLLPGALDVWHAVAYKRSGKQRNGPAALQRSGPGHRRVTLPMSAPHPIEAVRIAKRRTVAAAADWLADCAWQDVEPEDFGGMPVEMIVRGVERHYAGGWAQFLADGEL